jgi:anion-transporting  ArsA/GET3 family ATPase
VRKIGFRKVNASRRDRLALEARSLVVVTGKGGVGKSVVAAALGSLLAARGRRVLLLEADPRETLHRLLDVPPSGGEVVPAGERLALLNASPRHIIDDVVRDRLKIGALSRRVLASPIYEHFVEGAPGLKEMMLLGHALLVVSGEANHDADVVVLDAPASGHGLTLLAAPLLVAEVIGTGPIGAMASRIARHIADPARTGVILTALAEEMPVTETLETIEALAERVGRPPELVAVNGVVPPLPGTATSAKRDAVALWQARRRSAESALGLLRRRWKGPTVTLPLVAHDFGPGLTQALAGALEPQLARDEP